MNNILQRAQDAAQEAARRAQDAATVAAKKAQEAAAKVQDEASRIDLNTLQKRASAGVASAGDLLQRQATSLYERASYKEVVVVEGHSLQLLKTLGEGGFGFVFLARHTQTGKDYAVKRMIGQDRDSTKLATDEMELLKSLQHPNIIKLHASSQGPREGGGVEFLLVMELAGAGTLARWVTPDETTGSMPHPVSEERLLCNFHDVCKAVAFLHARCACIVSLRLTPEPNVSRRTLRTPCTATATDARRVRIISPVASRPLPPQQPSADSL